MSLSLQQAQLNAQEVLYNHITALNAHDESALRDSLHFPHIRLSATDLKIWPTADSYFDDFKKRAGGAWHHSAFSDIKCLSTSPDKVHFDVAVIRYDAQNKIISEFRSLWVITYEEGRWGAKMRSSFAQI